MTPPSMSPASTPRAHRLVGAHGFAEYIRNMANEIRNLVDIRVADHERSAVADLRVGGRGVGLIAALLAVKVALAVAARRRRLAAAILETKALHAGPRLDQRAVD